MTSRTWDIGMRVWAQDAGTGDWWPAKIISPEMEQLQRTMPDSTFVQWYGQNSLTELFDDSGIEPYDGNSKHLSTDNPAILAAIEAASADDTAYPLRQPETKRVRTEAPPPARRERKAAPAMKSTPPAPSAPQSKHTEPNDDVSVISDPELLQHKMDLDAAIATRNVPLARKILLKLARVQTTYRQMKATGIGLTVCSILSMDSFRNLHNLCRIVVRFWAQGLPEVTKSALRSIAAMRAHPDKPQTLAGQAEAATTVPEARKGRHFSQRLRDALALDGDASTVGAVNEVAAAFEALISDSKEKRILLIETLEKPGHSQMRNRLLSGELTPAGFFRLTANELLTPEELDMALARQAAQLAAKEESEKSLVSYSELFQCEKCGARKCTFYEQQTRGGDEPMTQFVTCHECGYQFQKGGYE
jgi:DNA-directed RNA polymerase subunit M/transcription elongation factor TFIIS